MDKKPPAESPDQGELFRIEVEQRGLTEPSVGGKPIAKIVELHPEGIYPDELEAASEQKPDVVTPQAISLEAVHEAVKTRNRRNGNLGKHSPMVRDGNYQNIRLGDWLPGHGPVTERRWEEAKEFARKLQEKLDAAKGQQPALLNEMNELFKLPEDVTPDTDTVNPVTHKPEVHDTFGKLMALRDAKYAGFLPTTHQEKNQAVELVDYIHNPKYPGGITDRLMEIFYKSQNVQQKQGKSPQEAHEIARDGVRSVINEWGDHLASANQAEAELTRLQRALKDADPTLKLKDVPAKYNVSVSDFNALIRYADLATLREDGDAPGFDPLRTRENRNINDDIKNKVIEDVYTAEETSEDIQNYIDDVAEKMTIRAANILLERAIPDQAARKTFWKNVLLSVEGDFKTDAATVLVRQQQVLV